MVDAISSHVSQLPVMAIWVLFFLGALVRGNVVYWIGRSICEGGRRSRYADRFTGPGMRQAEAFAARWGVAAVPLCFLTVGFQSMVLAATGLARMPLLRFVPAVAVGAALWATIYTTIGFAAWEAALGLAATSPWALALVAVILAGAALRWQHQRRHS